MYGKYVDNYAQCIARRLSFNLLWHQMLFGYQRPTPRLERISGDLSFVPIFFRTADRALYHSANTWGILAGY